MQKPSLNSKATKSVHISTRFTADLRARLEKAATARDRSLSEEIAARLENSFLEEPRSSSHFGGAKTRSVLFLIARAVRHLRNATGQTWLDHPFTFRHGVEAILEIVEAFRPEGDPHKAPEDILQFMRPANSETAEAALRRIEGDQLGRLFAQAVLAELDFARGGDIPDPAPDAPGAETTRALLYVASQPLKRRDARPRIAQIASVARELKFRKGAPG